MASQFIYGVQPVAEAERGRRKVRQVWRAPATSGAELERLCGSPDHQGVVAEVDPYPYGDAEGMLRKSDALIVALDQVQDPRNLGAVCRSAEAAGAVGVVIPERRAAMVTPVACKTSAGAVEHLEIAHVRNLADGWRRRSRQASGSGGPTPTGRRRPGPSTSPVPPSSSSAARERACGRGWPPVATGWWPCPASVRWSP